MTNPVFLNRNHKNADYSVGFDVSANFEEYDGFSGENIGVGEG